MSLLPMFGPYTSAYRFDNLAFIAEEALPIRSEYSIDLHPAGSFLYLTNSTDAEIEPFPLSPAFDIDGTAQASSIGVTTNGARALGRGLQFAGDGSSVLIGAGGYIEQHSLSTPYGGTATYVSEKLGPSGGLDSFSVIDGGARIIAGNGEKFYETSLSSNWDLTTAGSWSLAKLDLSGVYAHLEGFTFGKTTGQIIFCEVFKSGGDENLHEYRLSTPGDLSTASYVRTYDPSSDGLSNNIGDIVFGDGGKTLIGAGSNVLRQWSAVG